MSRVFISASDETLCGYIALARHRLVLVAPGVSQAVADAIKNRLLRDGGPKLLSVIVDIDPEVCRLGYGEIEAVDTLRSALADKGLSLLTQEGVRIGLIMADEEILVFSPTPHLIEAGSTRENRPNAIRISPTAGADIAQACGANPDPAALENQEVGLDYVDERALADAKQNLREVPPRKFDLARLERVFNYRLEYVEFSLEQFKLKTRTVPLPPELLGLVDAGLKKRLHNTFRIFEDSAPFEFSLPDVCPLPPEPAPDGETPPADPRPNVIVSEAWLAKEADRLRKDFFISLGSSAHGSLIQKRLKPEFLAAVDRLRRLMEAFAAQVQAAIVGKLQTTQQDLTNALLPLVRASPPAEWLRRTATGRMDDDLLRQRLKEAIATAFGRAHESYTPRLTVVFKGVNYDTIVSDSHFREKITEYFGDAEAKQLLSEYDASRARTSPS